MKILFCQSVSYPYIGIMSISAVLKKHGHETRLKIFKMSRPTARDLDEIRDFKPDILAFSVLTGWQKPILDFCKKFKETNDVITILGGPHATYCPNILKNECVDYICVGEGERSFPDFVNAMENRRSVKGIKGIWYKKDGEIVSNGISELPDLDSLPPMDIDLYLKANKAIKHQTRRQFSVNRGCPYSCTYCNSATMHGIYDGSRHLRTKSPDRIMEEIEYVYNRAPFKVAAFTSDNLFLNKSFLFEFLEKYKAQINLPFHCQMRAEFVTPEIARALKAGHCNSVSMGIESGSPRIRKEILGRQTTNEQIIKACRYLMDAGIDINVNNMVAIPGETPDDVWETIALNREIGPTTAYCSIFQPYPKSPLTERLIRQGDLSEDAFDNIPLVFFERSVLKLKNAHVFVNLHRLFYFAVKFPKLTGVIRWLSRVPPPLNRFFDIVFALSYCLYIKNVYKKNFLESFKMVFVNTWEGLKNK